MNQTKQTLYMSKVSTEKVNMMSLDIQVIYFFGVYILLRTFFFLPVRFLHGVFSDNKSVLEMSMCQNETPGSQLIFRLVIPKACSDTEKKVSVGVN